MRESSKSDGKAKRLKIHTEIAMVHGGSPLIFCAWEDIASDPNLTCEVLYRTLLREYELRDGLPPVLYLQLDNCIRENKNTVFIGFLCWLLERGIFKEILLSFLPVGHTHFDCDQIASCIGTAVRYVNITSVDELLRILKLSYSPRPDVSFIDRVADVSGLFNPGNTKDFPVGTSRIRFIRGCATKNVSPELETFMDPTSNLHWRIRKDTHNKVFIQTRRTVHDEKWSEQFYPFDTDAPAPDGREREKCTSGLLPGDLQFREPKPLAPSRQTELKKALDNIRPRMLPDEMAAVDEIADRLMAAIPPHTEPGSWTFPHEEERDGQEEEKDDEPEEERLRLRPDSAIFMNQNLQNIAREHYKNRGRADNELTIGKFVAIETDYTDETPLEDQNDFWLAKIVDIDASTKELKIMWYHTGTKENLNSSKHAHYSAWSGSKDDRFAWVDIARVLTQFDKVTDKGRHIRSRILMKISRAMALNDMEGFEEGGAEAEQRPARKRRSEQTKTNKKKKKKKT